MVDGVSLSLSLIALAISILGLIISWINHQRTFDPILALGLFKNKETGKEQVYIRNVGRGTAFLITVKIIDEQKIIYLSNPINLISTDEDEYIPGELYKFPNKEYTEIYKLYNNNQTLLYHLKFENEKGKRMQSYFLSELSFYFYKLTKREFKKYLNKKFD
ncbi:MAG: hypothetical protein FK730_01970 [Asgard group archaeon]|nr:hypothetical protein [Asgard group archaeon]